MAAPESPELRKARLGDAVQEHGPFVWRALRRLGLSRDDASDATQEVFLVLARRLDDVTATDTRPFLFSVARRVASTHRRDTRRRGEVCLDVEPVEPNAREPGPHRIAEHHDRLHMLQRALAALPEEQREVFVLVECEEQTAPETARILGIPLGTVASRLRRARAAFELTVRILHSAGRNVHGLATKEHR
jgi:RNA polymerase sigma-70 factor (ECF subfamily)